MSVVIIKRGLLDTIQDEGRFGFQHLGINTGGSMDLAAARVANMLVGNKTTEAVIELHFPAASFRFQKNCLIALSGADFYPAINNDLVPLNTAIIASESSVLKFNQYRKGCRCYLAVHGGWDAELWLSSYTTNIRASAGGYKGRALKKEDVIEIHPALDGTQFIPPGTKQNSNSKILPVTINIDHLYDQAKKIRCVTGNEYDGLDEDSKNKFQSSSFTITSQSDRMGYRLVGEMLRNVKDQQLLSSAVSRGTIQLLPSGELIILMADHQTTGGYPKIAHVISADFPKLAQMHPNEHLEFEFIIHTAAEEAFIEQQQFLQLTEDSIKLQLQQYFDDDIDRS